MTEEIKTENNHNNIRKKRHSITFNEKLKIIRRSENAESLASIARDYGLARSTICTIVKDKKKIMDHVKSGLSGAQVCATRPRSFIMEEMERQLKLWIDDQFQNSPISATLVQEKAKSIYEELKIHLAENDSGGGDFDQFTASWGWFRRFKTRVGIKKNQTDENFNNDSDEINDNDLEHINMKTELIDQYTEPESNTAPIESKEKPKKTRECVVSLSEAINRLKDICGGTDDNEFALFGRSIGAQLNKLPLSMALQLQLKIQSMITEARLSLEQKQTTVSDYSTESALSCSYSPNLIYSSNEGNIKYWMPSEDEKSYKADLELEIKDEDS